MLLQQCGENSSNDQKSACKAPLPQAIFNKDLAQISTHNFILKGHDAEEQVLFADGSELTLYQSGCEKISQEFRFKIPIQKEVDRVSLSVERLMYLSNLEDKYMSFANWAQAIAGLEQEFAKTNDVEVEPGFYVGLDKIDSQKHSTVIIRLFQR